MSHNKVSLVDRMPVKNMHYVLMRFNNTIFDSDAIHIFYSGNSIAPVPRDTIKCAHGLRVA